MCEPPQLQILDSNVCCNIIKQYIYQYVAETKPGITYVFNQFIYLEITQVII